MKIVIQNASAVWGGNEKWLCNVASGLKKRGHEVIVSCKSGPVRDRLAQREIRTTSVRPRGAVDAASALAFATWLRRVKPDTLLLTSWHPLTWSVWAARTASIPNIVVRLGIVRPFPVGPLRAGAMNNVDTIIANSAEIRNAWDASAPERLRNRVRVVLNGIESMRPDREKFRGNLRSELGIRNETLLIGGAGHLFPRKGFDYLLRAFAKAAIQNSHVAIAGDGEHLPELKALAHTLGIDDRVHFLGHRENGPEIMAGLDLFVLSSQNEGMANVMLEAMAGGTPVIASDISGVQGAIGATEGRAEAGWIVPPADDHKLANALVDVARLLRASEPEIVRRVDEAHWRVVNWFGIDRMVDECEAILFPE